MGGPGTELRGRGTGLLVGGGRGGLVPPLQSARPSARALLRIFFYSSFFSPRSLAHFSGFEEELKRSCAAVKTVLQITPSCKETCVQNYVFSFSATFFKFFR